jgi:hypothetical protein
MHCACSVFVFSTPEILEDNLSLIDTGHQQKFLGDSHKLLACRLELDFLVPWYQFAEILVPGLFGGVPTVRFSLKFHSMFLLI